MEKTVPSVFLSPSTQSYNEYITGGSEKYHMNRLADMMETFLDLAGIPYGRNDPDGDVRTSVEMSNAGDYGLHLPLHSNAAPEGQSGQYRGPLVMYYPGSAEGERAAEYMAQALAEIYPEPGKVVLRSATNLYELVQTIAPTAFVEVAFHDNLEDAEWITSSMVQIADHLTEAVANFFGLPYASGRAAHKAQVKISSGHLNVRQMPGLEYPVVAKLNKHDKVIVLRKIPEWSYIQTKEGTTGFAASRYLCKEVF